MYSSYGYQCSWKWLKSTSIFIVLLCMCQCSDTLESAYDKSGLTTTSSSSDFENVHVTTGLSEGLDNPETEKFASSKPADADGEAEQTFDKLYEQGVWAYDDQLWYSCASNIEKAIKDYKLYKKTLSDCRLDCSRGVRASNLSNLSSPVQDVSTFVKFLKDADCFRRCTEESVTSHPRLTERLTNAFERRIPYQYLQFCYFKLDRLKLAASAAYTYFLVNPDDLDTKQNIVYYRDKSKVPETDFIDLELVPYREHYIRAMIAYTEQDWHSVIVHMESCLDEYFKEHERCLADCEGSVGVEGVEFTPGVADLIIKILECKLSCEEKLSIVYTEPINFFLRDIYHYLQYVYYKEGDLEKSAEATASFLLLDSSHTAIIDNKEVLKTKLGYTDDDFIPNKDVAEYAVVRKEMQDLMDVINKDYRKPDVIEDQMSDAEDVDRVDQNVEAGEEWMSRYEKLGMHIISTSVDLKRKYRFVTDGVLKEEHCEDLLTLTKDLKTGPFGSQKFDLKVAKQRLEEDLSEDYEASLRLFIRGVEVVRHYTQRYLQIEETLYLKYTSIVCWSHSPEIVGIHDCYAQEDGTCLRFDDMSDELFSYAYTTVTYLSTADEDGDFQFLNENKEVDRSFAVKCGRTIGFNTGDRHAVKVPKSGEQRCAMVIRYTTHRSSDERDYHNTLNLLQRMDELRHANTAQSAKDVMKRFEEEGVKIVMNGEELKGKERFVADGLAAEPQCNILRHMVQNGALFGDGYDHLSSKPSFISPHTQYEMYQGINIYRASKLTEQNIISSSGLTAFLELSENARLLVEKYFNLTKPLYFDYTHLVCRTAIDESQNDRQDLSHPVHADNCLLQPDGSCTKDYPAFTQRDYSAILYLNDDFEGGEFFFAHSDKTEQISVQPKCGRVVGFNAGEFHGVKAVRRGQRCALALWFTLNPNFKELAHIQARKILKQVEARHRPEEKVIHEDL